MAEYREIHDIRPQAVTDTLSQPSWLTIASPYLEKAQAASAALSSPQVERIVSIEEELEGYLNKTLNPADCIDPVQFWSVSCQISCLSITLTGF